MTKIVLDIKNCSDCPNFKKEKVYTKDSWEDIYDWFCKKKNDKKIQGYVE